MLLIIFFMFICSSFSCFGSLFRLEYDESRSRNASTRVFSRESGLSIPSTLRLPSDVNVARASCYISWRDAQSYYKKSDLVIEIYSHRFQSVEDDLRALMGTMNNNQLLQECTFRFVALQETEVRQYEKKVGRREIDCTVWNRLR